MTAPQIYYERFSLEHFPEYFKEYDDLRSWYQYWHTTHTFRATGIMAYLDASGMLEHVQRVVAHESTRTAKLYDRTGNEITLDEVERIRI